MRRCRSAGETGDRKIKAAPEKMHRAAFAAEAGTELLEHAIALHKNAPEAIRVFGVVGLMLFIVIERDRILDLVWRGVDGDRQFHVPQCLH